MPKQVVFYQLGGAEVLQVEEQPLRDPLASEVRIKVAAIGLNRAEVMFRMGAYLEQPELPARIGYDAAGTVDAVGDGVDHIQVGEQVATIPAFSMNAYGVYGESAIVPAHAVAAYPPSLTPSQGASVWMPYMTAWGALVHYGSLSAGQAVLITAASSSVGIASIQMVKEAGATAIATTRGRNKANALVEAGADHVVVTDEEDLAERVLAITDDQGADIVFDPVAGPTLTELGKATKPGGVVFVYGALATAPTPFPLMEALGRGLTVRGYTLFEVTRQPDLAASAVNYISTRIESGAYKPLVSREFKLDDIVEAHRFMESNAQIGKIVVVTS
ncbi:MAG: zinc-dependent alcohol dehydrogenase family protein [Pseudomonadota bacterium]